MIPPVKVKRSPRNEPVVIAAIPKDALVMDAGQMKAGVTRFLNGNWRVLIDVKDPVSGKAPSLRYQIENNKGTARGNWYTATTSSAGRTFSPACIRPES